jgi:hypothetical protein
MNRLAVAAALYLNATAIMAQSADDPSVTLNVSPQNAIVGATIVISGMGYPQPGVPVVIAITPPDGAGAPTSLEVTPASGGSFTTNFSKTQQAGIYTVTARMGAKGSPAKSQFAIRPILAPLDEAPGDWKPLTQDTTDLIHITRTGVENLPDSPPRTKLLVPLEQLEAQSSNYLDQYHQLEKALEPFRRVINQHPDSGADLQPLLDKLNDWEQKAKKADDEVRKQIEKSKSQLANCDRIDETVEALKAVSAALNLIGKPYEIIINFVVDYDASKAPKVLPSAAQNNPNASYAAGESVKAVKIAAQAAAGIAGGPTGMFIAAAGLVTDAIALAYQDLFNKYCQKFEGPFTARMVANFYAVNHKEPWWKYSIEITGKLTLRYPKEAGGNAVALTGQFEGAASKFTYDEEVWANSDLIKLVAGGKVLKKDTAPVAIPPVNYEGSVANTFSSPTSFYIPVTGQFANNRITFTMQDARSDFLPEYTQAHTFYVVFSVYTLLTPILGHFSLPYKDAHWVLDHYKFDYPVTTTGDVMQFVAHDDQLRPTKSNRAEYTLDLKACNPGC